MRPLGFPIACPDQCLPTQVDIVEVGPRDGLQSEDTFVPTAEKQQFIQGLKRAGLRTIEATSMVSTARVPQFSDAEALVQSLRGEADLRPVLVPNEHGLERALGAGVNAIAVFVSATEAFAVRNLGMDRERAITVAEKLVHRVTSQGIPARGYVSMSFGDPWEGAVVPQAVVDLSLRLFHAGCYQVSLGDTIGVATPGQVKLLIDQHAEAGISRESLALHFHDTYGQALANVYAGLQAGISTFDSSTGGLGGCPFAMSSTGNLATEDLLWLLTGLGISTGISLDDVVQAGSRMTDFLGKPRSRIAVATLG